ncbi:hypothetical protein LP419_18200 [Massilia sp. H-1]|nr:hypothetical protein LP419_18200 [Massilia sp. H-1]
MFGVIELARAVRLQHDGRGDAARGRGAAFADFSNAGCAGRGAAGGHVRRCPGRHAAARQPARRAAGDRLPQRRPGTGQSDA